MKKQLLASLLGISLILTACQSTPVPGTTSPSATGSGQTTAPTATSGSATSPVTTAGAAIEHRPDVLTFAAYDDYITFDLGQLLDLWDTEFPAGEITAIDFDFSDTTWWYTVDGIRDSSELSLRVNAVTGEVYGREEENDDDDDKVIDFASILTLKDALAIAQAETSADAIVHEWKLDWDWAGTDTIWYDFELENPDLELSVNAVDRTVRK